MFTRSLLERKNKNSKETLTMSEREREGVEVEVEGSATQYKTRSGRCPPPQERRGPPVATNEGTNNNNNKETGQTEMSGSRAEGRSHACASDAPHTPTESRFALFFHERGGKVGKRRGSATHVEPPPRLPLLFFSCTTSATSRSWQNTKETKQMHTHTHTHKGALKRARDTQTGEWHSRL